MVKVAIPASPILVRLDATLATLGNPASQTRAVSLRERAIILDLAVVETRAQSVVAVVLPPAACATIIRGPSRLELAILVEGVRLIPG